MCVDLVIHAENRRYYVDIIELTGKGVQDEIKSEFGASYMPAYE